MTSTQERPDLAVTGDPVLPAASRPAGLLTAVGIRDAERDAAALAWAVDDAAPGLDTLHVVHAYAPLPPEAVVPTRELTDRHRAAREVAARAVQLVGADGSLLRASGSAIPGAAVDVLGEIAAIVDLLVIGDDTATEPAGTSTTRAVLGQARCPVVAVPPAGHPPAPHPPARGPVTVVVGPDGLDDSVMHLALDAARRRGATLQASLAWTALHRGPVSRPDVAAVQEQFDIRLARWRAAYPDVPFVGRIELGEDWPQLLRRHSSLIVAGRGEADPLFSTSPAGQQRCPVLVVPIR